MPKSVNIDKKRLLLEKMKFSGISSLTDLELISILISKGSESMDLLPFAESILQKVGSWEKYTNSSDNISDKDLGVTSAQFRLLQVTRELCRRTKVFEDSSSINFIKTSSDVNKIFRPLIANLPYEEFWMILLNSSNRIIDKVKISQGLDSMVIVDMKVMMRTILDKMASVVVFVHNHPSGDEEVSRADLEFSVKARKAFELFDIKLLDNVIITPKTFVVYK